MTDPVADAVAAIRSWGEERDWRGYDPYDGLNSPAAGWLSLGTPLGRRALTQVVKLSPLNLRPALRIRPAWNAKALALVASGYARLWSAAGDPSARREAGRWLAWLVENHAGEDGKLAWGYHFPVETRVLRYDRGTPNAIATSFAAQALLDGCELLGEARWREPVRATARFLIDRMLSERRARAYFRYLPGRGELVHNASLLACAVLVRAARLLDDRSLVAPAEAAVATSLAAQRADGSWPYAGDGHGWVDNFHTAYVLDALAECAPIIPAAREPLTRGIDYWERALFLADGTPMYFPDRTLPLDAHCYATAIDTWLSLDRWHEDALGNAERVARLLITRMLDPSGYVHFQRRRLWVSRVPFVRWTTAPTFRALAGLLASRGRLTGHSTERAGASLD